MTYDSYGLSLTYFPDLQTSNPPPLPHFLHCLHSHCAYTHQLFIVEWSVTHCIMGYFLYIYLVIYFCLRLPSSFNCLSVCLWLGTRVSVPLYSFVLVPISAKSIQAESCENVDCLPSHINSEWGQDLHSPLEGQLEMFLGWDCSSGQTTGNPCMCSLVFFSMLNVLELQNSILELFLDKPTYHTTKLPSELKSEDDTHNHWFNSLELDHSVNIARRQEQFVWWT